jgi:hypothetical protein
MGLKSWYTAQNVAIQAAVITGLLAIVAGIITGAFTIADTEIQRSGSGPATAPAVSLSPAVSGSPSASTALQISAEQRLWNMIPGAIQNDECVEAVPRYGAEAERACSQVSYESGQSSAFMSYFIFKNSAALDQAYTNLLIAIGIQVGQGDCGNFTTFRATCEAHYANTSVDISGRILEYLNNGYPALVYTDEQQDVLIYTSGLDGTEMISWWADPADWITVGG